MSSPFRIGIVCTAVIAASCCCSSETWGQGFRIGNAIQAGNGQGFRIGNVMQAGGGQGFRMGFGRAGMHFGGGQGATIGGQNYGMRFGNGQGARIGGPNYGMQFGGGQGTQIGQLQTTPPVQPGTYYYGDIRGSGPVQGRPTMQSGANSASTTTPTAAVQTTTSQLNRYIRLSHSADADETIEYQLNGTKFSLAPGDSVLMSADEEWNLAFSSGEGMGNRQATLAESGNFEFGKSTSEEGWVLIKKEPTNAAPNGADKPTIPTAVEETSPVLKNPEKDRHSVLINEPAETSDSDSD